MELNLLVFGAIFAGLFTLYSLVQTARGLYRVNFISTLLAFLAVLVPLAAIATNHLKAAPLPMIDLAAAAVAVIVIAVSAVIFFIEYRRARALGEKDEQVSQSRGALGIGVGTLLIVATLAVPFTMGMVAPQLPQAEFDLAEALAESSSVELTEADESIEIVQAVTSTPAPTTRPVSANQADIPQLPTVPASLLSTPILPAEVADSGANSAEESTGSDQAAEVETTNATASGEVVCYGTVTHNLNMRAATSMDAEVLLTIPYNTEVPLYGQSDGGFWLAVEYDDEPGWVSSEYINKSASCGSLPTLP